MATSYKDFLAANPTYLGRANTANRTAAPKKRDWKASLLPAAGAIGAGLLAAPLTGGLSLAGTIAALGAAGAVGGGLGELGAQKANNERLNLGRAGKEALISGAFGAGGAAIGGARGLRAAKAAGVFGDDATKLATDVARGTLKVKDISRGGVGGAKSLAQAIQTRGIGAFDPKEGLQAIPNAAERVATANQYGIKSGFKGLQQATSQMGAFEKELTPLLTKTRIPAKDVIASLDDIARNTTTGLSDDALNRIIEAQKQNVLRQAKGGYISGKKLRSLRTQIGNGLFKGAESDRKVLLKDVYSGLGDVIGKANPKAREIIGKQHGLLDLGEGLAKRSKDARIPIPLTGFGGKVPGAANLRDRATDTLVGALNKAGTVGQSGLKAQAVRQGLPRAMGYGQQAPAVSDEQVNNQMWSDESQQATDNRDLAAEYAADPTNPKFIGVDPAQFGYPPDGGTQVSQSPYSQEAVMADIQRDPKNASTYLKLYETFGAQQQKAAKPLSAAAKQQNALVGTGLNAISNLRAMFQQDPSLIAKTGVPGRNILGVGNRILGLGQYEAMAQQAIDSVARLRTGAAMTPSEETFYRRMVPQAGDSPATVNQKLDELERYFASFQNTPESSSGATPDLVEALMAQQGAY